MIDNIPTAARCNKCGTKRAERAYKHGVFKFYVCLDCFAADTPMRLISKDDKPLVRAIKAKAAS